MFTGRIDEIGEVAAITDAVIVVRAPKSAGRVRPGGSLNIAGARLTVEDVTEGLISASVSDETRRRTTFDRCAPGQGVNVEPVLAVGDPLDGHLVQGHVDAVGKVVGIDAAATGRRVWIRPPSRFLSRVVAKGSIAVDGASLTVAEVLRDRFSVVLIPATLRQTTLEGLAPGDRVNLESDLVARLASGRGLECRGWQGHRVARLGRIPVRACGCRKGDRPAGSRGRSYGLGSRPRGRGRRDLRGCRDQPGGVYLPAHPLLRAFHRAVRT